MAKIYEFPKGQKEAGAETERIASQAQAYPAERGADVFDINANRDAKLWRKVKDKAETDPELAKALKRLHIT